jgi:6-phosphogluconolactonase/glucosamine-6-phosphate isomerase/deaminase
VLKRSGEIERVARASRTRITRKTQVPQVKEQTVSIPGPERLSRRVVGNNVWLGHTDVDGNGSLTALADQQIVPSVLASEEAVGQAMLQEIEIIAAAKQGDLVVILLGGRGAQALHRLLGELALTSEADQLLKRLHVFTQDALAPMRMDNGFSFVRDFERLLGLAFFRKVKSFSSMRTDTDDLENELARYVTKLESLGGIDLLFLGLGPEAAAASHLAYIRPGSGATAADMAGMIPISASILEHHIAKFIAGGSSVTEVDQAECRAATHILTLGPAAILSARRIVQSIVDASTAPAKRESYRRLLETEIDTDLAARAAQLDENPGLWLRLHPNVRSLVLPDVLTA